MSLANRCRHLIKTFYSGQGGWTDQQLPDGIIILTAPTGHTYSTQPHGFTLFPALAQPTGDLGQLTGIGEDSPQRAVMMPRRRQTREQDRRDRINQERRERTELIAEEERQTPSLARRQLRTTTILRRRSPWRQTWSPGRHIAAILLVLFAVRPHQGRLFVPVDE